ncbi:MAG: hypothetical protein Q4E24_12520 [bacterium]|nr:hypothetical protein [bacterium]
MRAIVCMARDAAGWGAHVRRREQRERTDGDKSEDMCAGGT